VVGRGLLRLSQSGVHDVFGEVRGVPKQESWTLDEGQSGRGPVWLQKAS